jgi:hypothetical protein
MKTFLEKLLLSIIIIVVIIAGIWDVVGLSSVGIFEINAQASQKRSAEIIKQQKVDATAIVLPNIQYHPWGENRVILPTK